ncbi:MULTISPECIES: purine-nucleoside phosphorylase [Actinomadura]|uniref:Purine nucleoside phosphorylase n=2 Tax=Actinomadura TaxID=1988 RepID=A0A7D3VXA6_ACTVE|nr:MULTISPECIES: purine-nucleoside phosphorylase [Actinomadura]MBO2462900.1 purine-nucleoside phosphorylase [Actinomadura violacea]QKG25019.1 purine nucleotide phosphorylase [Actinomadura verrucosospora]
MSNDAFDLARAAADELRTRTSIDSFDVALVMGSGWVPAADALGAPDDELPVTLLPGFAPPAVEGHAGKVRIVEVGGHRALVFLGRTHLYEGRGVDAVVHGVRTALAAGVGTVVLTNAAGGLRPEHQRVGDPVLIADHLNLSGANPLTGPTFLDMTEAYSAKLRALAKEVDPTLSEGVYAAFRGPTYETPAEIRMLRTMGADMIGMSTVLETIAARQGGADVLGISLVTNIAAGLSGEKLDHEEVLAAGRAAAGRMGELLGTVLTKL